MKFRILALVSLLALAPCAARADFSEGAATVNYRVSQVTPYTFDATAAGVSDAVDMSACDGGVSVTFDQSVEDGSTDAKVEVRACATSADEWQSCVLLRNGPEQLPDGVAVSIGNFPTTKPYALLRFPVGPSSDTARVVLSCTEETTTTSGGSGTPDDDSVTDPKMGADDFGDWSCAGTAESCTLDAGVVSATEMSIVSGSDFSCIAGACLIGADKIALGTDTTGGYAASVSEGGPATTATALVANGANCSADTYPLGVDASGAVEGCATVPSAGITNGTIVNEDVNASAAVDATKLAYAGGDTVGAGTVEAALDELSLEKADASDILTASQVFRTDADSAAAAGTLSDWSAAGVADNNAGLKLPQGTAPAQTGAGLISWDTSDNLLNVGDGSAIRRIGSAAFFETFGVTNIDPDASFDNLCLLKGMSGTSQPTTLQSPCFNGGTSRTNVIFKPSGATGWISKLVCLVDSVSGIETGDVLEVEVVEDTLGGSSPTVISSLTFTGTSEIASNTVKAAAINAPWSSAETALGLRVQWTDADAGGETSGLYLQCVLSGWM